MKLLDRSILKSVYNIQAQSVNTSAYKDYLTYLIIHPHQKSQSHCHIEREIFIVVEGQGQLTVKEKTYSIKAGDSVEFDAFETHSISNPFDKDLIILSIVWLNETERAENIEQDNVLTVVTSTPPTPNGNLHLGHMAGPYLRADIVKRSLQSHGRVAFYFTGRDDHQSYTAYAGLNEGLSAREVANINTIKIRDSLCKANIQIDNFQRPDAGDYQEQVIEYFKLLVEGGHLILKESQTAFCQSCDKFLYEVYVYGGCPHCHDMTGGNFCESCGNVNDCAELKDAHCKLCDSPVSFKTVERYYFPLNAYRDRLKAYYKKIGLSDSLMAWVNKIFKLGLNDFPASHESEWGIPLDALGKDGQIIAVWFEMGLGHLHQLRSHFNSSQELNLIQCFGFDNSYFNLILFPCVFMALNKNELLPVAFISNQFYCLNDSKFSTSRNHAIWCNEFFTDDNQDLVRFYLSKTSPEDQQTSFDLESFQDFSKNNMFIKTRRLAQECLNHLARYFSNKIPDVGLWNEEHIKFYKDINRLASDVHVALSPRYFSLLKATSGLETLQILIHNYIDSLHVFFERERASDEARTAIVLGVSALILFSRLVYPIMPTFSQELLGQFHLKGFDTAYKLDIELREFKNINLLSPYSLALLNFWKDAGENAGFFVEADQSGYYLHSKAKSHWTQYHVGNGDSITSLCAQRPGTFLLPSDSSKTSDLLRKHCYRHTNEYHEYYCRLDDVRQLSDNNYDIRFNQEISFKDWLDVLSSGYAEEREQFQLFLESLYKMSHPQFRFYLAYRDGNPVATGLAHVSTYQVGVFCITSNEKYQDIMACQQILQHILFFTKKQESCTQAVVQTSVDFFDNIYQPLGFRKGCELQTYLPDYTLLATQDVYCSIEEG